MASLLLNQNNPTRPVGDVWNNRSPYLPPLEATHLHDHPSPNSNQQLTQLEILQAISQIGMDNIPAELLQQLRGSLGEGALASCMHLSQAQPQMPIDVPLSALPTMANVNKISQQSSYNADAMR